MSITSKITKRKDKMFIHPSLLIPNDLNKELYSNEKEELRVQRALAVDFQKNIDKDKTPNIEPVLIWKDGLIQAGHTRTAAALLCNCEVWVQYAEADYPDIVNEPFSTLEDISNTNISRVMTPSVKLNEFEMFNKSYVKQYGINRTTKLEDIHLKSLKIGRKSIKQLQEIKQKQPELLKLIDASEMNIIQAWNEATGRNKTKIVKSNNPNRDWSQYYTHDIFNTILNRVSNTLNSYFNVSTNINGTDYYPAKDFTKGYKASMISHLFEVIGAEVLKSKGFNVRAASGHPTDPDIYHIDIDDKIEIKVTNFDSSSTKWKGGMGIREGQYILITYDETISRWMIIFTPLTAEDWKSAGMGGHTLPIKNVLENHKNDMDVIYGELYLNNGKVVAQLETLN